jgi:hypothetical protein
LSNYDQYIGILNEYYVKLERKFYSKKLSHKQFIKSLEKLDDWEEQFVQKFEIKFEEEEE